MKEKLKLYELEELNELSDRSSDFVKDLIRGTEDALKYNENDSIAKDNLECLQYISVCLMLNKDILTIALDSRKVNKK